MQFDINNMERSPLRRSYFNCEKYLKEISYQLNEIVFEISSETISMARSCPIIFPLRASFYFDEISVLF